MLQSGISKIISKKDNGLNSVSEDRTLNLYPMLYAAVESYGWIGLKRGHQQLANNHLPSTIGHRKKLLFSLYIYVYIHMGKIRRFIIEL